MAAVTCVRSTQTLDLLNPTNIFNETARKGGFVVSGKYKMLGLNHE